MASHFCGVKQQEDKRQKRALREKRGCQGQSWLSGLSGP